MRRHPPPPALPTRCHLCGYWDWESYDPRYRVLPRKLETCPSCGFDFRITDERRGCTDEQWQAKWIEDGMCWSEGATPEDWDPMLQMLRGGVDLDALGL